MTVFAIRARMHSDAVPAVEAAARRIFTGLDRDRPEGFRFVAGRLSDGVTYLILVHVEGGAANPLDTLPEYQEFLRGLKDWRDGRSEEGPMELVGSYRLF